MKLLTACCLLLAGCGCTDMAALSAADADAAAHNERSLAAALASAGLTSAGPPKMDMRGGRAASWVSEVREVTMRPAPADFGADAGKMLVAFPPSETAPTIVRDAGGKLHVLEVRHAVTSTRSHRACGCGPNAGGGAEPPPPPTWYVVLDAPDAWGGPITVEAKDWIEIDTSYPNSNDRMCHEIP